MTFDIIILSHMKDHNKLPFLINSIRKFIVGYNKIFIITPDIPEKQIDGLNYITDDTSLVMREETKLKWDNWVNNNNFNRQKPSWIKQQFIKLFNNVSNNDYLVIDSDILFLKKINVTIDDKPTFFLGRNQMTHEYFNFSKKIMLQEKKFKWSFISELMFFKKHIIKDMLEKKFNGDYNNFIEKSIEIISDDCFISEFELYGNYTYENFKDMYRYEKINYLLNGKNDQWSDEEIKKYLENNKNREYDIISLHSWN